jgi:CSLREA domain-containing protein
MSAKKRQVDNTNSVQSPFEPWTAGKVTFLSRAFQFTSFSFFTNTVYLIPFLYLLLFTNGDEASHVKNTLAHRGGKTGNLVAPTTISIRVNQSTDDAEEAGPDATGSHPPGYMDLTSSDIELTTDTDATGGYSGGTQKIGMRFRNITIPQGATITDAYIVFRAITPDAPNTNNGATSLTFRGQAADNPGTFTSTSYDITGRATTSAAVAWSPSAWTAGTNYNSPVLTSIVQEIIDRSGWASGNSLVMIVTGTGSRTTDSYNGSSATAPQLVISYTTPSPGGVSAGLLQWLRADVGTTIATGVSLWTDQSSAGRNATQGTGANQPLFSSNAINFNPALSFNGTSQFMQFSDVGMVSGANTRSTYAVAITDIADGTHRYLTQYGTAANGQSYALLNSGNEARTAGWAANHTVPGSVWATTNIPRMIYGDYTGTLARGSLNGNAISSTAFTWNTTLNTTGYIGTRTGIMEYWNGRIAEVIQYNSILSVADINKVNSYLAIKYGVTLDQTVAQNYTASDGTTVFWNGTTNATYKNNIAGIARDDASGLSQKQSKSVNSGLQVAIGNGNTIAATNTANATTFSVDKSALVWGDNAGSVASWTTTGAPGGYQIIARKWKLQETGVVGSVKIQVADDSGSNGLPSESKPVLLLVDSDGDFTSGAIPSLMTLNGTNWETNVDFLTGYFFTFALPPDEICANTTDDDYDGFTDCEDAECGIGSNIINGCITVNSTGDGADFNPGDGVCADINCDCTLRAAIQEANALSGHDTICFNIAGAGPHTIAPLSQLPQIVDQLTIDGYSQAGAVEATATLPATLQIVLSGASLGAAASGIIINHSNASNSVIKGLTVNNFNSNVASGIYILWGDSIRIEGNHIGTDATGMVAAPNKFGIQVYIFATNTIIGGSLPAQRNVISGNSDQGVRVLNGFTHVINNYIGAAADGMTDLGNSGHGVFFDSADGLILDNVISGNSIFGIHLDGPYANNTTPHVTIQGNLIGIARDTTTALGNSWGGINVQGDVYDVLIGGSAPGDPNIIANNNQQGIVVKGFDVSILSNAIYSNGSLGIDLGNLGGNGVTANDANDSDIGANDFLNFIEINQLAESGGDLFYDFDADLPVGNYRIEFFNNPSGPDPSGNGEGEIFIREIEIYHAGSGTENFTGSFTPFAIVNVGDTLSAVTITCLDATCTTFGPTSEFSASQVVTAPEICDNLLDDDGDGLVDCLDSDCAGATNVVGGINLGRLTNYLFVFTNGSVAADVKGTSGFIGGIVVDGIQATEVTSGGTAYAGTIYTNDNTLDGWTALVDNNDPPEVSPAQAFDVFNQGTLVDNLETDLAFAFAQINALSPTIGYTGIASTALNGLNTQNAIADTFVINITSGFTITTKINITGDAEDIFILRWDTDANDTNGYQGQVRFQAGGAIVPLGGLTPTNFISVAGDITSSGGGLPPLAPYPQGPRLNEGTGALIANGSDWVANNYFTGYWLTTGAPASGVTGDLSHAIFTGGWYTSTNRATFSGRSGGINLSPNFIPLTVATIADTTICGGDSLIVSATASGGNPPYTYHWSDGLGIGASFTVVPLSSITYTVTVTDANCNSATDVVNVTVLPAVQANASADIVLCQGENTIISVSPSGGTGGFTYTWDNGLPALPSHTVSPSVNTVYNVTVTDAVGCSDIAQIRVNTTCGGVISNQIWWDMDEDGIKDNEETGIQGMTVGLFNTTNVLLKTTISQSGGFYQFDELDAGAYIVRFEPFDGFTATSYQVGPDGTIDSDITFANETAVINLAKRQVLDSIDAGFYACSNIAYNAVVSSEASDEIHIFDYFAAAEQADSTGVADEPQDIKLGPDSKLYMADKANNRILILQKDTMLVDTFITDVNLNGPEGLVFGPDGLLYVSNKGGNNILRYNYTTLAFVDVFLDAADGISEPGQGIEFDRTGALYVTSNKNIIKKFDGETGAFISDYIITAGGAPPEIGDFLIHSDSMFYVSNMGTDLVARYNENGTYIDDFVTPGSGGLVAPTGMSWGPDNNLYVVSSATNQVKRYNGMTGGFIENYYSGSGLGSPQGIAFFPDADCCNLSYSVNADTTVWETLDSNSYIINMGIVPQTTQNGLLPYGMVYELIYSQIPVKWVINPAKAKDGIDFSHNGVDYRGGPFVIPIDYNPVLIDSLITKWEARGVVGNRTVAPITVPVRRTIDYGIHWTLDQANGDIAENFLLDAMIPASAYDWALPNDLNCCHNIFVMPHANPGWNSHSGLFYWNAPTCEGGCAGAIWAGCRSGSYIENSQNPLNAAQRLNFLMENPIAPETDPAVDHGLHDDGSTPPDYLYALPAHPIMQFLGLIDDATQGGSEQIYLPTNAWRPTTTIAVWDDSHADVPTLSPGEAAVMAFGHAFGNESRGYVSYTGGHDIGGTDQSSIAAQRSFFNFSILAAGNNALDLKVTVPDTMIIGQSYEVAAIATGGNGTANYQWTTNCNGSFLDPTAATTTFTSDFVYEPTTCQVTCIVTDDCFIRTSFFTATFIIAPNPVPPVAIDDFETTEENTPVTLGVMQNDYDLNFDIDTSTLHTTGVRQPNNGSTIVNNVTGEITYTPGLNFTGIDTFEYVICDLTSLCDTAQVVINITCSAAPGTNIIEGIVFEDIDLNAVFNAGDIGTDNAKIRIYLDNNQNGIIDIGEIAVDSTLTIVDGSYSLTVAPNFYVPDSLDRRVIATSDDAREKNDGSMESLSSSEVKFKDAGELNGFRFQNINIPSGSIITEAYIAFTGRDNRNGITNIEIHGEQNFSSDNFLQIDDNISDRTLTTNSVAWSIPNVVSNGVYNTPDISNIVQEIIGLTNWDIGNHTMTFIGSLPVNGSEKKFKSYDHTAQQAPMLVVKYQRPAAVIYQYIIEVDTTTLGTPMPQMTTPLQDIAIFTFTGQTDCANNFGFQNMCNTLTDGGTIIGDEAFCDPFNPALINSSALPAGSWDSLDYKWQFSTVSSTGPWTDIPNSDADTYDPDPIVTTTYYRRQARHSGCTSFDQVSNVVAKLIYPLPTVSLSLPDTEECISSTVLPLSGGNPVGGSYAGTGVSGSIFNASIAGVGTHIITYTYVDGNGCGNTATDNITVHALPVVGLTLVDTDECVSSTTLPLSGGSPVGGTYSGTGVSGTNFNASVAGVGSHTITYTYTDGNGCTNTATDNITVDALPVVNLTLPDTEECVSSTTMALSGGTPLGGTYSGTGVSGTNFDASVAGVGSHSITYTYTDGNGCTNTATDNVTVHALPVVNLTLPDTEECVSSTTMALSGGTPLGGTYSGTGVSGTNFDASVAGVGSHSITYTYTDGNGCTNFVTANITVFSEPSFSGVSTVDPTTCSGMDGTITITAAGGSGSYEYRINGGSWQSSNVFNGLGVGSYNIDIRNDNGTCVVNYTSNPVMLSNPGSPTAQIIMPASDCPGTGVSFIATDAGIGATYTWDFGANASPATATGIGPHNVTYSDCGVSVISLDVSLAGCNASDSDNHTTQDLLGPTADAMAPIGPLTCHSAVPVADINDVINETDNCGGSVTVTYVGDNVSPGCNTNVIRTYRLSDGCGNQTDITQLINVDMSGIDPGSLTIDSDTVCLSLAMTGVISATPDGNAVVPCNYNLLYLLTTGASDVIMDTSSTPDFLLTGPGDFAIHTFIYDSLSTSINYFDISGINLGTMQLATLETMIEQGGGSICSALDMTGAAAEAMVCSAAIGDFVWQDDNEDGVQDGGEPGIEGVTVRLYNNANTLIATTTTDVNGAYLFNAINSGTYYLIFDVSTNVGGITAFKGSLQNIGSEATDSDINPATSRTHSFLLDASLGNMLTLDAGYILSCPPDQRGGVGVIRK